MTTIKKGGIAVKDAQRALRELGTALKGAKARDGSVDVYKADAKVAGKPAEGVLETVKDLFQREVFYGGGCGSTSGSRMADPDRLSKAEAKSVMDALLDAKKSVAAADTTKANGRAGADGELSASELVRAIKDAGNSYEGKLVKAALSGAASSSLRAIISGEKANVGELVAALSRALGAVEGMKTQSGTVDFSSLQSAVKSTWPDDGVAAALLDVVSAEYSKTVWVTVGSGCTASSERRTVPPDQLSKADTTAVIKGLKKAIDKLESSADRSGQLNEVGMQALERVLDRDDSLAGKLAGAALAEARSAIEAARPRPTYSYSSSGC